MHQFLKLNCYVWHVISRVYWEMLNVYLGMRNWIKVTFMIIPLNPHSYKTYHFTLAHIINGILMRKCKFGTLKYWVVPFVQNNRKTWETYTLNSDNLRTELDKRNLVGGGAWSPCLCSRPLLNFMMIYFSLFLYFDRASMLTNHPPFCWIMLYLASFFLNSV